MPFVTVGKENSGNIDLYYEDHGNGRPIVLIHGYPLSGRAWERQVPTLVNLGYRVITYDRRGFGHSSQPWSGYDYDTFTEDLNRLVTELDLRDFALMGHSMGGGEVVRYLGKNGGRNVSKAIILAGIPPYLLKATDNPEGVDGAVFDGIEKAVIADRPAFFAQFFADFYNVDKLGGKQISEHDMRADWITAVNASPKAALDCVGTWGTDFRNDLKQISVPTLVIQGDSDRIVPFAASGKRMPALIKGSKLVVIEGAPHGLAWTHAERVNREVSEFLGKAAQTSKVA
jgi:pimeloyl-ACP methyl ester carboxylesterase